MLAAITRPSHRHMRGREWRPGGLQFGRRRSRPGLEMLEGRIVLDAGNTLATALDLGVLTSPRVYYDAVGATDRDDFLRFNLTAPATLAAGLDGLTADADLQLIRDANGNNVIDTGDVLASSTRAGTASESITQVLAAGTYFVRVYQYSGDTSYRLTLSATAAPVDGAGNTLAAARNAGALTGTQVFTDFIGTADHDDFYRFNLASPATASAVLDGLTADADLQLIRDANGNNIVDTGDVLATSARGGTQPDSITQALAAGTYFARVYQYSGDTNYRLTLTATAAPAPTLTTNTVVAGRTAYLAAIGNVTEEFNWASYFAPGAHSTGRLLPQIQATAASVAYSDGTRNTVTGALNLANWLDSPGFDGPGGAAAADLAIDGVESFDISFGKDHRSLGFAVRTGGGPGSNDGAVDLTGATFDITALDANGVTLGTRTFSLPAGAPAEAWVTFSSQVPFRTVQIRERGNNTANQYFSNIITSVNSVPQGQTSAALITPRAAANDRATTTQGSLAGSLRQEFPTFIGVVPIAPVSTTIDGTDPLWPGSQRPRRGTT